MKNLRAAILRCSQIAPFILFCAIVCAALLMGTSNVYAQNSFTMLKATIDGGGGSSIGGEFRLGATIGQPDAGQMKGGAFMIFGGFWAPLGLKTIGGRPQTTSLWMPLVSHTLAEGK